MSNNQTGLQSPASDERPHPDSHRNAQGIHIDLKTESEHEPRRTIFSTVAEDEPGALSCVVSLAARRQFNIKSLTVGPAAVEDHSHIMTVVEGPEPDIDQTGKQLAKLRPVTSVGELDGNAIRAELVLLKVHGENPDKVHATMEVYDGCILDAGPEAITVQLIDDERKIGDAVDMFRRLNVTEVARIGQTALAYGSGKTVLGEEPGTSGEPTRPNTNIQ